MAQAMPAAVIVAVAVAKPVPLQSLRQELPSDQRSQKRHLMCPRYGKLLKVKNAWAGKRGSCPKCDGALSISADALTLWLPEDRSGPVSLTSPDFDIGRLAATPSNGFQLPKGVWQRAWDFLQASAVSQALIASTLLLLMLVALAT